MNLCIRPYGLSLQKVAARGPRALREELFMVLTDFKPLGGDHAESTNLANLLNYHGMMNPFSEKPFSEALCFGIAGGIGAGYSWCPSVIRHGGGCGVSLIGRHQVYSTQGAWYRDFADRLRFHLSIAESTSAKKAEKNLLEQLENGRPGIVATSRFDLPFLGDLESLFNVGMHSFIIYGIDEKKGIAYGADIAAQPVTLSILQLLQARERVCSHKTRVIGFLFPSEQFEPSVLQSAIREGIQATYRELTNGRMKTFSLPGWEMCAKAMVNDKAADGWLKALTNGLIYDALRNLFASIETAGTGTGLYRKLYASFLDEAATVLEQPEISEIAADYRQLAAQWTEFAEECLPDSISPFKQTKKLLRKQLGTFQKKGSKGQSAIDDTVRELGQITKQVHEQFPLSDAETRSHLQTLRERLLELHAEESKVAEKLKAITDR
jgi:hypothetical protein